MAVNTQQLHELLYEALETEMGGQKVYENAIQNALTKELREEWQKYLSETQEHEKILRDVFNKLGLDPEKETPGRKVVRYKGEALVRSMEMARNEGSPENGELVAAEAVVDAEMKDHQNWELIGKLVGDLKGEEAQVLNDAHVQVEEQEDEHLYHTMGWARELWIKSLGMEAIIPPPEEKQDVRTREDAAEAAKERGTMLSQ